MAKYRNANDVTSVPVTKNGDILDVILVADGMKYVKNEPQSKPRVQFEFCEE